MNMIKIFVNNNAEAVKIVANGDVLQLKPISSGVNNITNENDYRMDSVKSIFHNIVTLQEIKRLNTEEDKSKMKMIKKDVFNGKPIAEICKKYGIRTVTDMKDVTTTTNIAFFNYRCNYVNKVIHSKATRPDTGVTNIEGIDIWKDLILVCKKFYKNCAGFKTYVNNSYRVESIGKYITLIDTADESNVFSMER